MTTSGEPARGPEAGRGRRAIGAGLAAGISLFAASVLGAVGDADVLRGIVAREVLFIVAVGAGIGVPVGAVLGWVHAPAATASRGLQRVGLVGWLATWAVFLGAGLLAFVLALGGVIAAAPDLAGMLTAAGWAVILFLVGLITFGIPAWILAAIVSAV